MKSIVHVCQSGTAAALIEAVVGDEVIAIPDDCAVGPLGDVDSSSPDTRTAFWAETYSFDEGMQHMDWRSELCIVHDKLANLGRKATEIVIWAGSNPTEQTLRRRVHWWLKDTFLPITEVIVGNEDRTDAVDVVDVAVAEVSADRLGSRFERRFQAEDVLRIQLANEWIALRDHGHGVRVIENDRLLERPITYFDPYLLSLIGAEPVMLTSAEIIGRAMSETRRSDSFCKWRIVTLLRKGQISLVGGDLHDWQSVKLCRS